MMRIIVLFLVSLTLGCTISEDKSLEESEATAKIEAEKELSEGPWVFTSKTQTTRIPSFANMKLPENSELLDDIINKEAPPDGAIMAAKYLLDRGLYDFVDTYWSNSDRKSVV